MTFAVSTWECLDVVLATNHSFSNSLHYELELYPRNLHVIATDYQCNNQLLQAILPQLTSKLTPKYENCTKCDLHEYVSAGFVLRIIRSFMLTPFLKHAEKRRANAATASSSGVGGGETNGGSD